MRGPYGLEVHEDCRTCKVQGAGFFCHLSAAALKDFDAVKSSSTYPEAAILFLEKQEPRGIFVLCEGQVKLSISSSEGKTLIVRIVNAGEILGLMSILSDTPYEVTAETIRPCQVAFVRREDFQRFISKHPEAYQNVTRQLASQYQAACEQLRTVGLASSAPEKLAKFLLDWSAAGAHRTNDGTRIKLPLTHEEIAELIGTTRETVTRTLSSFKGRHLVAIQGSTLMISNRAGLESFVGV